MDKNNFTYKEIMSQVEAWEKIYNIIISEKYILNIAFDNYDEIIFFGCGSSYNLSQSASFFTKSFLKGQCCFALPSSELLTNTGIYINEDKKYLIIGFSRSGETSESINVVKLLKNRQNITSFTFSCKEGNTISRFSDYHFTCGGINEKSVVMTVSFSGMLFAYCSILAKFLNKIEVLAEFKYLIDYLNKNISDLYRDIEEYLKNNNFSSYFIYENPCQLISTNFDLKNFMHP